MQVPETPARMSLLPVETWVSLVALPDWQDSPAPDLRNHLPIAVSAILNRRLTHHAIPEIQNLPRWQMSRGSNAQGHLPGFGSLCPWGWAFLLGRLCFLRSSGSGLILQEEAQRRLPQ